MLIFLPAGVLNHCLENKQEVYSFCIVWSQIEKIPKNNFNKYIQIRSVEKIRSLFTKQTWSIRITKISTWKRYQPWSSEQSVFLCFFEKTWFLRIRSLKEGHGRGSWPAWGARRSLSRRSSLIARQELDYVREARNGDWKQGRASAEKNSFFRASKCIYLTVFNSIPCLLYCSR